MDSKADEAVRWLELFKEALSVLLLKRPIKGDVCFIVQLIDNSNKSTLIMASESARLRVATYLL